MAALNTLFFDRCLETLEKGYSLLSETNPSDIHFDLYRSACIKEFEILIEQSAKLLRKRLHA